MQVNIAKILATAFLEKGFRLRAGAGVAAEVLCRIGIGCHESPK
jgi:hypothetical protein